MTAANVFPLLPTRLPDGRRVEVYQNPPEVGGLEIVIWDDDRRDAGDLFAAPNQIAAHRFLRKLIDRQKGGAHG